MSVRKLVTDYSQSLRLRVDELNSIIAERTRLGEEGFKAQNPSDYEIMFAWSSGSYERRISSIIDAVRELTEFLEGIHVQSVTEPIRANAYKIPADIGIDIPDADEEVYLVWLYQDSAYKVTGSFSEQQQRLLILEYADKERQKFERLTAKFSAEQGERVKYERERIPENVRIEVWRRDQGKCASCGSREKLEYDHIVPVSRGGSNTTRNVELLCEVCNRAKGNRIQ